MFWALFYTEWCDEAPATDNKTLEEVFCDVDQITIISDMDDFAQHKVRPSVLKCSDLRYRPVLEQLA